MTTCTLLSQEALLAMPDSDYMNDDQLAYFEHTLSTLRNEILREVQEAKERIAQHDASADPIDAASDQESMQTALRVVERRSKLLKKVNASLEAIQEGNYGYCSVTGDPIGLNRLLARPTATLSIAAKERQEFFERTSGAGDPDDHEDE